MWDIPAGMSSVLRQLLRRILRQILVIALMLSLFPGVVELLENAEHLLHDGHLPHSSQHELARSSEAPHRDLEDEHGCTPLAHHCSCHSSAPVVIGHARPRIAARPALTPRLVFGAPLAPPSRANAPPTPPPIA